MQGAQDQLFWALMVPLHTSGMEEESILAGLMSAPDDYDSGDEECASDLLPSSSAKQHRMRARGIPHVSSSSALDTSTAVATDAAELSTLSLPMLGPQSISPAAQMSSSSGSCDAREGEVLSGQSSPGRLEAPSPPIQASWVAPHRLGSMLDLELSDVCDFDDLEQQQQQQQQQRQEAQPTQHSPQTLHLQQKQHRPVFGFPENLGLPAAEGGGEEDKQQPCSPHPCHSISSSSSKSHLQPNGHSLSSSPGTSLLSSSLQRRLVDRHQGPIHSTAHNLAPHRQLNPIPDPIAIAAAQQPTLSSPYPAMRHQTYHVTQKDTGLRQQQQQQQQQRLSIEQLSAFEDELQGDGLMQSASSLSAAGLRVSLEHVLQQDDAAAASGRNGRGEHQQGFQDCTQLSSASPYQSPVNMLHATDADGLLDPSSPSPELQQLPASPQLQARTQCRKQSCTLQEEVMQDVARLNNCSSAGDEVDRDMLNSCSAQHASPTSTHLLAPHAPIPIVPSPPPVSPFAPAAITTDMAELGRQDEEDPLAR